MSEPIECPFKSLETAVACHVRDWSADHRDAWIWGIVCGWDEASLKELTQQYKWTPETVARLKRLRSEYKRLTQGKQVER